MYYIYTVTNKITGKQYVGFTKNPEKRKKMHWHEVKSDTEIPLYIDMFYIGKHNFSFDVIGEYSDKRFAKYMEYSAIVSKNTVIPNGYNIQLPSLDNIYHKPLLGTKQAPR